MQISPRRDLLKVVGAALTLVLLMFLMSLDGVQAAKVRTGSAGWAVPSLGANYLALPEGRGHRVRITGPGGSLVMVSNDAGPALSEQRLGRIADIAVGKWEFICGVDRSRGRCQVTIEYLGKGGSAPRTLPATDTVPRGWSRLFSVPS